MAIEQKQKSYAFQISIIIPCYNVPEEQICRALLSVQQQSFKNYEIIVVDDGSQEEYAEILRRCCGRLDNTTLIRTDNHGVSSARNTGVAAACGDFIAFLDADDVISQDFLERSLIVQQDTSADLIIGGAVYAPEINDSLFPERTPVPDYNQYQSEAIQHLRCFFIGPKNLIRFPGGYVCRGPVARLVKAELAKSTPFDSDLKNGEDIIWNMRLFSKCRKLCIVREVWYGYWINPDSFTHRYLPSFFEDSKTHIERLPELLDFSNKQEYAAYLDRIFELLLIGWANYLSRAQSQNPTAYKNTIEKLYSEYPWTEVGGKHCFSSVGIKRKLICLSYRARLYFFLKTIKEKLI